MANLFNILKIKSSQKQYKTLQPFFETNEKRIEEEIYSMRSTESNLKTNEAARHCVITAKLDSTGKPLPFYVLTKCNGLKESFDITQDSKELMLYLSQNVNSENTKSFLNAAASILTNIQRISKGKIIIGYTNNTKLKDKFIDFDYSSNTSDTELNYAWGKAQLTSSRMDILKKVLGAKYNSLPKEAISTIVALNHPFNSIYWRVIKYQIMQSDPLNEKVFAAIKQCPDLQQVLDNGNNLNGLNLGSETQLAIILKTIRTGGNVDDLRTANCWLDVESMKRKLGD